jgi:DNA transformation protein
VRRAPGEARAAPDESRHLDASFQRGNTVERDSFVSFVLEQLAAMEGLDCRPMFGGHGLYRGATFFGILHAGRLYLKTTEATRGGYARAGMQPFRPSDRQTLGSYYEVPADVLESRATLLAWADEAAGVVHAAKRAARARRRSNHG